ncbi:GntR family transcriptional regulator [Telmatospirillum sp. J64-1]|uniref:GntR family transcriptional regulator n=1 Tax=Telmatospirillum sp. J64-1 TaxID=2502183 RepID=UPI00115C5CBE|nr:GntR family transcriptional regulator [Telmatospirillum sp. J64-1]
MKYSRLDHAKVSDLVLQQLETLILSGALKPGEKLPPERDLAERLEVSRPTLREALQALERNGLVHTRHGGGTYVTEELAPSFSAPLVRLFQAHPGTATDYLEFRRYMEPMAAYCAALRRTEADCEILTGIFTAMEEAHQQDDAEREAELDAAFHMAMAEAAHNVVLLHVARSLSSLLREGVFYSRSSLFTRKGVRDMLLDQHRMLYQSIVDGAPVKARDAAESHLRFVEEAMGEVARQEARADVARLRLERAGSAGERKRRAARKKADTEGNP